MNREEMRNEIAEIRIQNNRKKAMKIAKDIGLLFNDFKVIKSEHTRTLSLFLTDDKIRIDVVVYLETFKKEVVDGVETTVPDFSRSIATMWDINNETL